MPPRSERERLEQGGGSGIKGHSQLGRMSMHREPRVPRRQSQGRAGDPGKGGTYLPLRKLCCSEGLGPLSRRTEAHTRQTFLLPDPQWPLPGGGGRSREDRLRVTIYQASPGLVLTGSPRGARTPSPLCNQTVWGRVTTCLCVPGLSALIYHPGQTAARLCAAPKGHLFHWMWINTTTCICSAGWGENSRRELWRF